MSGLSCLFGLHALTETSVVEVPDRGIWAGRGVWVIYTSCERCGARVAWEVIPVAELPQSDN